MLKKLIKKSLASMGYQITRYSPSLSNPFGEIGRLCNTRSHPIIFDIGAYHGDISLTYRQLLTDSTVYAFEPFPESFDLLRKNTMDDPNIRAFNLGLSDFKGPQLFSSNLLLKNTKAFGASASRDILMKSRTTP